MSIKFDPCHPSTLGNLPGSKVKIPLDLLAHFDPAVDLSAEKLPHLFAEELPHLQDLLRKTQPVVRSIAEQLSMALFGSTKAVKPVSHPFIHVFRSYGGGAVETVHFMLSHESPVMAQFLST